MPPIRLGLPCFTERRGDISGLRGIYMYAKAIGFVGVILVLAACSSTPEPPPAGPAAGAQNPSGGLGSRNIVPGSQQDLEASAGDRIFFAFDRSDISPEAQEILSRQADWLRRYPNVAVTI